ncbi:hypothetical protein B0H16DRAFT_1312011, partial [Mycena metata]
VTALYDYEATTDEEFDFQKGDIIAVTAVSEDGWWSGELMDDNRRVSGRHIFPSNFVSSANLDGGQMWTAALHDYKATIDAEFDFQKGDIIAVTAMPYDGWWSGELLGENRRVAGKHIFPSNFVTRIP